MKIKKISTTHLLINAVKFITVKISPLTPMKVPQNDGL